MPTKGWMMEAADTLGRKPATSCRSSPARPQTRACELSSFNWTKPWDKFCLKFQMRGRNQSQGSSLSMGGRRLGQAGERTLHRTPRAVAGFFGRVVEGSKNSALDCSGKGSLERWTPWSRLRHM